MAIYHFEGQIISRKDGRSSVAAAAYRSCSKLYDERTGLTHDFRKKGHDLVCCEILIPEGASDWMKDRSKLWNEIERLEKRYDGQLAREFNISLPIELSDEENWKLAKEFVQKEFVDRGMVADIAFHRGGRLESGEMEQPHIHVMLSLREIENGQFGNKNRDWNDKILFMGWRKEWANILNLYLARNGIDMRADHRTLEAQGLDLIPQKKKGWDYRISAHEEHLRVLKENGERIIADPSLVLKALNRQQSTFTSQDIARMVNRYTVDADQFKAAYHKALDHPELIKLAKDDLGRDRYTSQEQLQLEVNMINQAVDLANSELHPVKQSIRDEIAKTYSLRPGQQKAFNYLLDGGDARSLIGLAGTGKSYLLKAAREAWEREGYQVIGMTLSGKAAENLEDSSKIQSRTIASYLLAWEKGFNQIDKNTIVVIDESGMVDSKSFARIVEEVKKHSAKIVQVGDFEQIQAIGAGAAGRAIAQYTGFEELTEVVRQKIEWQREATVQLATCRTREALSTYQEHGLVHSLETKEAVLQAMIDRWQEIRLEHPAETQIMLAYTRKDVEYLNEQVREIRKHNNELVNEQILSTATGRKAFAEGDRIYFTSNEYQKLDVKNGTLGTIERIEGQTLTVRLDDRPDYKDRIIEFSTREFKHFDHGYAATLHKGQGITVDRAQMYASEYTDRHAAYVGMSRHRETAELYYDKATFKDFDSMLKTIEKGHLKDFTLDYVEERKPEREFTKEQSKPRELSETKQLEKMPNTDRQRTAEERLRAAEERIEQRRLAKAEKALESDHVLKILKHKNWDMIKETGDKEFDERIELMKGLRDNALKFIEKPDHFKAQAKALVDLSEKTMRFNHQWALFEKQAPELSKDIKVSLPAITKELGIDREMQFTYSRDERGF